MAHKKLIRFAEIATFSNVLQYPREMQGKWRSFFKNTHPIVLELACGKGEYSIALAQQYPNKNFIGVDIKGNRLWVGAKKAREQFLNNVAFLRIQIELIDQFFAKGEVDEIWIIFPDPQLRISKSKKRLTHPRFLRSFQRILRPGGKIHLKTDSPDLYRFTKKVIEMYGCRLKNDIEDLYAEPGLPPELRITTYYESLDIAESKRIFYLCFTLPEQFASEEMDKVLQKYLKDEAGLIMENEEEQKEDEDFDPSDEGLYYLNDSGFVVFTADYLLQRGYCCGNGCLNCPYDYKAVPEPRRSFLLEKRNNN